MKNRIGKVEISKALVESFHGLFQDMNPIHIEEKKFGIMIYTCLSECFDEIKEGEEIPFYDCDMIEVTNKEDKKEHYITNFRKR